MAEQVLLLTGVPGVGKPTLAEEMFDQLAAREIRPGARFNDLTAMENLRVVWRNYAAQGISRLILVRMAEGREDVQQLAAQIPGAKITGCQLQASAVTIEDRLRRREVGLSVEPLVIRGRELSGQSFDYGLSPLVIDTELLLAALD